jgi:hypothetical protein
VTNLKTPRNDVLGRLDVLVGRWEVRPFVGGEEMDAGHTEFQWLDDGAFLVQRSEAQIPEDAPREWIENSPFPVTTIIGLDDHSGEFIYAYADGRNVHRVQRMTFDRREWRTWGQSGPEFHQRFFGMLSEDGATITGRYERSRDGVEWELDFEIRFSKVG